MDGRWINLVGAVNVRDLGGLPTRDGRTTRFGQVIRSDNLQGLTDDDVRWLTEVLQVSDVIDLRTELEITHAGPGPMTRVPTVTIRHLSLYVEGSPRKLAVSSPTTAATTVAEPKVAWHRADEYPTYWTDAAGHYVSYLHRRPDSLVTALRTMASATGATVAHCAAGKDRTSIVCAMALAAVDVEPDAIVADYVQTGERLEAIIARLLESPLHAPDFQTTTAQDHWPHEATMRRFLHHLDTELGGARGWLEHHGWTAADTDALRARLVG